MNKERDELEKYVINGIFTNKDCLPIALDILEPNDFVGHITRRVYSIILELKKSNTPIDMFEVNKYLNNTVAIVELTRYDFAYAFYDFIYQRKCLRLKEFAVQDQIDLAIKGYYKDRNEDIFENLDALKDKLKQITDKLVVSKDIDAKEAVILFNQEIEKRLSIRGLIPSGLSEFDRQFGGFDKGDLILIAARPSIGKTALAISSAYNQIKLGYKVHFFSFEMSLYQLMLRFFAIDRDLSLDDMRINLKRIPNLEKELFEFSNDIQGHSIIFDFKRGTDFQLINKAKSVKDRYGTDIIYIDYLDYVYHSDKSIKSEPRQIGSVTKNLKTNALDFELPTVLLAQLNRETEITEKRLNKVAPPPPKLHNIRNSGEIEQDCDTVIFIDRPEKEGYEQYCDGVGCLGTAQIIVRKQRNGKLGRCTVSFNKLNARFQDESISGIINPNYNPNGFAPDVDF